MKVRDLLDVIAMTGAQTAILEAGGTWRVEGAIRLNREDARKLISDKTEEAERIAESEVGMVDFCRDHIHVIYRPAGNAERGADDEIHNSDN